MGRPTMTSFLPLRLAVLCRLAQSADELGEHNTLLELVESHRDPGYGSVYSSIRPDTSSKDTTEGNVDNPKESRFKRYIVRPVTWVGPIAGIVVGFVLGPHGGTQGLQIFGVILLCVSATYLGSGFAIGESELLAE